VTQVVYRPIGFVRSPFKDLAGMPLQSVAAGDVEGTIEIEPEFVGGLQDIAGFSHLFVIAHLHRGEPGGLVVLPFLDDTPRGVFATRSPRHPNPIGLSTVRLLAVAGSTLHVCNLDLVDGTPVLDVKPYVPEFDHVAADRIGWFTGRAADVHRVRADARFER
jgi:tRNA-Thr(GGU) m(6)t(6)A37 methyltransferase TsaA